MTYEEHQKFKQQLSRTSGVPLPLLNGETPEEDIATARALVALRREHEKEYFTPGQKFEEWLNAVEGITPQDEASNAISAMEDSLHPSGYPSVTDRGETGVQRGDGRPAREQFAEWFAQETAFDPFKHDGWTPLA